MTGIHDFEFFFKAIMEIFAFKVGVGPNGPQQYLLGLRKQQSIQDQTVEEQYVIRLDDY